MPGFREHFRVVRYELPGHGGTPAQAGSYTIGGLAMGVLALLDSLGVGRFAYCGISIGGMIGMSLAAKQLTAITAPTLVLAGADDPETPPEHGEQIAARIERARLEVVQAAHLATAETPGQVTSALLGYLRAAAGTGDRSRAAS